MDKNLLSNYQGVQRDPVFIRPLPHFRVKRAGWWVSAAIAAGAFVAAFAIVALVILSQ